MGLAGSFQLVRRSIESVLRLGLDELAELAGQALPRTREQACSHTTLNGLVTAYRPDAAEALPSITTARLPGIDFESSNCLNFLVEVEFADDDFSSALPRTMYVKLPCAEWGTRIFGNTLGFWELETFFCAHIEPHVPIRTPRVYAAARKGGRFALVLENLSETPGLKLFTNRDVVAGTPRERAVGVLRSLAELHAHFWNCSELDRERLLPAAHNTYTAPRWRSLTHALNLLALEPAHKAAPDLVTERIVETCRLALGRWDDVLKGWYQGPLTLVHGDSHLGNCFEYSDGEERRVGMLDFQAVHWSKGMRDVQYFLINSLDPALLESEEEGLIRGYCAELEQRGVSLSFADAWEQYRAFSYQTLMVGIVPLGLGSLTERDATVRTFTERSARAVERLGFRDWVEGLPRG